MIPASRSPSQTGRAPTPAEVIMRAAWQRLSPGATVGRSRVITSAMRMIVLLTQWGPTVIRRPAKARVKARGRDRPAELRVDRHVVAELEQAGHLVCHEGLREHRKLSDD